MKRRVFTIASAVCIGIGIFVGAYYLGAASTGSSIPVDSISEPEEHPETSGSESKLDMGASSSPGTSSPETEASPPALVVLEPEDNGKELEPPAPDTSQVGGAPSTPSTPASGAAIPTQQELQPQEVAPPMKEAPLSPGFSQEEPNIISFEVENIGGIVPQPDGNESDHNDEPDTEPEPYQPEIDWVDLEDYADQVFSLTNQERSSAGLGTLEADPTLNEMAMVRAKELVDAYSHTRPDGTNSNTIYEDFGADLTPYGENIHKGVKTPGAAVNGWMGSAGHKANILRDGAQYMGVGVWQDDNGRLYWVQMFAIDK